MPWVRAQLRGTSVLARVDGTGALVRSDRGLVEIRYRAGGKRYDAKGDSLEIEPGQTPMPDDAGETPEPRSAPPPPRRGSTKARASAPAPSGPPIVAYTDGACSGNPGPAGLGVVLIDGDRRVELSEYLGPRSTNNVAELTAILRALREVPDLARPIVLHTDSQYAIGVLSKGWKAKANADLVAEIRDELAPRAHVELRYVPGHAGVLLNERADELARAAVASGASRRDELTARRAK